MKRLNTDREIAPIVAQFVPVKLDIASKEYSQWRRDHPAEGNSIPKLFIVRADGETIYGKSGSLIGNDLPIMLAAALQNSGRILSHRESVTLVDVADKFERLKESGEIKQAVRALSKIRNMGDPGMIASYSAPAMRLNRLVTQAATDVSTRLKTLGEEIEGGEAEAKLAAILQYLEIRREYGALKLLKSELAAFQKSFTTKDNSQLTREAKVIDSARFADSKSKMTRAAEKLTKLIAETKIDAVKTLAEATQAELKADGE